MRWETLLSGAIGVFGAIITYAYGEWSELLSFFLLVVGVDIVTGVAASVKEGHGLRSRTMFWGLAKKGLILLVILLAHRMDVLMGTAVVMDGAIYFYLANELLSITENYGRLGLPLPDGVKRIIAVLKGKAGGSDASN